MIARRPSRRFIDRVFAAPERAWIDGQGGAPEALWSLWAAKEAAYKVVSSLDGEAPPFRHAAFVVEPGAVETATTARVAYEGRSFPVRIEPRPEGVVLAVSWAPEGREAPPTGLVWGATRIDRLRNELGLVGSGIESIRNERFNSDEARAVHSVPSAMARLALRREAAARLDRPEASLAVICPEGPRGRVPPQLVGAGEGIAVSLSHHGAWVAWAVRTRPAAGT